MHTETNMDEGPRGDEAERWLWKQWSGLMRLRRDGVPVLGFTWYSLTDQMDWDVALRERHGRVNPRGLCDLDRRPRAAGRAYKRLIETWREVLLAQGPCLGLPLAAEHPAGEASRPVTGRGGRSAFGQTEDASPSGGTTDTDLLTSR
jgi:hypothetical protein